MLSCYPHIERFITISQVIRIPEFRNIRVWMLVGQPGGFMIGTGAADCRENSPDAETDTVPGIWHTLFGIAY